MLNWLRFHLIEILKPLLAPIFLLVPVLIPFEEGDIIIRNEYWRYGLPDHSLLHDHFGSRLVQRIVNLRVPFRWLVFWLRFRPWLEDQLHLPHGLEVVRHPDPFLPTWRLEDAPAEDTYLLVLLHLLPQLHKEATDLVEFSSFDLGGEGAVQEAGDIGILFRPLAWIVAGIGGVYGDVQGLDVLHHPIEAFDCGQLRFREM